MSESSFLDDQFSYHFSEFCYFHIQFKKDGTPLQNTLLLLLLLPDHLMCLSHLLGSHKRMPPTLDSDKNELLKDI